MAHYSPPMLTGSDVADRLLLSNMMAVTRGEAHIGTFSLQEHQLPYIHLCTSVAPFLGSISVHELTMSSESQPGSQQPFS